MSAERYRVTEYQHSGLDFLQIERGGSTHELCAQTDDSMIIGAIRQQSSDIAELKVDVSGLRSSEAVFKFECDQLRTKLGEMVGRSKASRDDLHRALGRTDDTIIRLEHELSLSRLATERHKTHIDQCGEELKTTRAKPAAVVAKRNEWAGGAARLSSQLGNLLAVIHRDGGHYEAEHGTEKACADAVQRICDTRAGLGAADELAMLVRRLARALQKSSPDSDLPKTAMDYLSIAGLAGSPMRRDE